MLETAVRDTLRTQLEERRTRLRVALVEAPTTEELVDLLGQVDRALDQLGTDAYGRCVICEEHVSEEDLVANPLLEYCLCSLTPRQQRALEHDLGLARRLQVGLLPDPDVRAAGWHAHYRYEPAGVVSGDYCDLWMHPEDTDTLFFAVADVSGKGVAASLLMTHIQAAFRSLLGAGVPLGDLVARVNRQLLEASLPAQYATLACGRADADGHLEIVNAGHCPPMIVRGNVVESLGPTGVPVGLLADQPYDVTRLDLEEGQGLVLYTDGLTEARDSRDEEYEFERLKQVLAQAGGQDPRAVVDGVRSDLTGFLAGSSPSDDLTVMALVRSA